MQEKICCDEFSCMKNLTRDAYEEIISRKFKVYTSFTCVCALIPKNDCKHA